jgi:hypothetical protein
MQGSNWMIKNNLAFTISGFWWSILNNMNAHVDSGENIYAISGRVNAGSPFRKANHMSDRIAYYNRAVQNIT